MGTRRETRRRAREPAHTDPRAAGVRVLVLTTFDLDEHVYAALAAGASGFLLKDVTPGLFTVPPDDRRRCGSPPRPG